MIYQKEIPVFFTIDNSYAPFLAAALSSAIKNCSPQRQYKAIILHQELTKENMEKLSLLATGNFSIEFVEMKDGFESITDRMSNRLRCDYFTLTIYFRLFIATMFPQYDKAIYIDSDVVVLGDLAELFDTDIGDNFIGACADKSVVDVPELARYMEEAVGVSRYEYINSGVLLMNLKALRENEFDKHFLNLLNTYHFDCIAPDQDYINAICNGKIHYLDEVWDAMPNDNAQPLSNAKLIHYNLFSKPWCYEGIQYGDYFWEYVKNTEYENDALEFKKNYSEEQKQNDSKCLELLIKRGAEICEADITFLKIKNSGVKIRL